MRICITTPEEILSKTQSSNLNEMVSDSKMSSSIKYTKARATESPDVLTKSTVYVLKAIN